MNRKSSISIGKYYEDFIQSKIRNGRNENESEVLIAGL